jgi:hypothetical protein
MPGGLGVNLVRQYRQAGLANTIPFLSAFTVDESTQPAQKDAALGFFGGANWAPDMKNPASEAFVKAYEAEFKAVPGTYAMKAYDAALLIDAAVKAAGGKLENKDAICNTYPKRPPGTAFAQNHRYDRHTQKRHFTKIDRYRLRNVSFFRANTRIRPGSVNQRDNRQTELVSQPHQPQGLPISLRMRRPKFRKMFSLVSRPF